MSLPALTEVAAGVYHIPLLGAASINAYLVGDVLVDAGIRSSAAKLAPIMRQHRIRTHVLTHPHPDHQGASHFVCSALDIPLWAHEDGAELMTRGAISENTPRNLVTRLQQHFWTGPAHPVCRALKAGDDVAGFEVLSTPGHAKGHLSLWRESDGVLIVGDVLTNMNVLTTQAGLHEPLPLYTLDPARNRESIQRLAALKPELALFGHGQPLRDPEAIAQFAEQLGT